MSGRGRGRAEGLLMTTRRRVMTARTQRPQAATARSGQPDSAQPHGIRCVEPDTETSFLSSVAVQIVLVSTGCYGDWQLPAMAGSAYRIRSAESLRNQCGCSSTFGKRVCRPWRRPDHPGRPSAIGPSEPMQNDQTCFFSNIFSKFYNIIKIII